MITLLKAIYLETISTVLILIGDFISGGEYNIGVVCKINHKISLCFQAIYLQLVN